MHIASFTDLIKAARAQPQPQRLLFAFARAELPDGAGSAEQAAFAERRGGALAPVMCVDKRTDEISSFGALLEESRHTGADWDIVFVTTLSGQGGVVPTPAAAEAPLNLMVTCIHAGDLARFLAFGKDGELLHLSQA